MQPLNISCQPVTIPDSEGQDQVYMNYLISAPGVTAVISVPIAQAMETIEHMKQITMKVLATPEVKAARAKARLIVPR